jgi:ribosomal protein S18 acetylase RimI-like enzyme
VSNALKIVTGLDPALEAALGPLLELAVGSADPGRLRAALQSYAARDRHLLGARREGALVAVAGYMCRSDAAVIGHIAVRRDAQRDGIGRRLLDEVAEAHPGLWVEAETDAEAVRFYGRCGFEVLSLGERYPGTERFTVKWPPQAVHLNRH